MIHEENIPVRWWEVSAGPAEQAPTEITHTPHGGGTCVEVVLVGFGGFLAAFSPYKIADLVFDFSCQLAAGHRGLCWTPSNPKAEVPEH